MWELRNENPIYDTELMFHDDNKHGIGKLDTVVWSPDGKKCGMFNGEIGSKSFVYTLETEECASRGTYALAWSSDGKWLATSTKGEVTLWDDSTGRKMGKIEFPEKTSFYNMKWSPTGNNIAICAMTYPRRKPKRTIVILNPSKGTISRKISVGGYLIPEWNSTGTLVFGIRIGPYASFPFWDIKKGKIMHEPLIDIEGGILSSVVSPKLSPDGISIIGAINNQLYVCDTSLYIGTPQTEFIIPPSSMTGYEGSERQLEDVIEKDPSLIGFGYRLLGRQVEAGDGRIDLLLESPDGAIVVGELKKEKADDTTAGQILRYLVWVEENYPRSVQPRGIIVASEFSNNLKLAIRASKYKIRLLSSAIIWDNYSSNGGS
jgi:WD40 repeat protein